MLSGTGERERRVSDIFQCVWDVHCSKRTCGNRRTLVFVLGGLLYKKNRCKVVVTMVELLNCGKVCSAARIDEVAAAIHLIDAIYKTGRIGVVLSGFEQA